MVISWEKWSCLHKPFIPYVPYSPLGFEVILKSFNLGFHSYGFLVVVFVVVVAVVLAFYGVYLSSWVTSY